jgi:hypothetical protein
VIFTESLVTQAYLEELLILKGGFHPEEITLFRGNERFTAGSEALKHWQEEIGDFLPSSPAAQSLGGGTAGISA